ncbi:MAG: peptidylprolyl isomerase [Saprospiraceae bacterium]|nr:MAG: peptidylprolyl isomerase [Saprospiraceae bacterium]
MALIGKIRRQKWLLTGSLAVALFLFIAMLMFDNPNQSFLGGSATMVGEIEGRKIESQEFNATYEMLYRNIQGDSYAQRTSLWNTLVDEAILTKLAEDIGIGVSKTELLDLQFSTDRNRLSPIITSRYINPNTGQLDYDQLNQLKNIITTNQIDQMIANGTLPADFKARWSYQEREIIKDRLQTKVANLIAKALYTPTWMAEMISLDQNTRVDFEYVLVPFDEIDNSEVTLEDADYKAYFEENKEQFRQDEETRKLEYVVLDVVPTAADSAEIRQRIADLLDDFANAEDDSLFVETNYGTLEEAYYKKAELSPVLADTIESMSIGQVFGPYVDEGAFKAAKLIDKKVIPDSVRARHILRPASDQNSYLAAVKTIDSLKTLIESGKATFDSLAAEFGTDGTASKGGDLGFFGPGTMVKPFNDLCFYKAEPGKLYTVTTQFGVHLVEVTDRKFGPDREPSYRVAYIAQDIVPSQSTQDSVREVALQLIENNPDLESLRKSVAEMGMSTIVSAPLKKNDFVVDNLGAGEGSREMVRWAFGLDINSGEPEIGDVAPRPFGFQAPEMFYTAKYVVAGLYSIRPAGLPSYKDVKAEIEPMVINRKKGELIASKMQGLTDLQAIANTFGTTVDTALNVNLASTFIPNVGPEPKVVAKAWKTEIGQVSGPVIGNAGVFAVKPFNKPTPNPVANLAQVKLSNQQGLRSIIRTRLMQALRKQADITDNRARFF